jgi:LysM repeat protein
VAQGEGLHAIATRYGSTVQALMDGNNLSGDLLMIDQPLFVLPGLATGATVSLTAGPRGAAGAELLSWQQARWLFNPGKRAVVRDLTTGKEFRVRYMGGSNHADCEPETAADTALLREIAGAGWSWDPRSIWITVDGRTLAASMNTMPHGVQTNLTNSFDGHFCLYFWRSRGHASGVEHAGHQAAVLRAADLVGAQLPPGL